MIPGLEWWPHHLNGDLHERINVALSVPIYCPVKLLWAGQRSCLPQRGKKTLLCLTPDWCCTFVT